MFLALQPIQASDVRPGDFLLVVSPLLIEGPMARVERVDSIEVIGSMRRLRLGSFGIDVHKDAYLTIAPARRN